MIEYMVIDTETTGLDWNKNKLFSIGWALPGGEPRYLDIREESPARFTDLIPKVKRFIFHNAKFDLHFLRQAGIIIPPEKTECTMVRAGLINENLMSYSLDYLGKKYCKTGKTEDIIPKLHAIFGGRCTKNMQMPNLHKAPASLVGEYCKQDIEVTRKLFLWQENNMQGLDTVYELEKKLFVKLMKMETHGVRVDIEGAHKASEKVGNDIKTAKQNLYKIVGRELSVQPSGDLRNHFEKYAEHLKHTTSGNLQVDAAALKKLAEMGVPEALAILNIRKLEKLKNTFLDGHLIGHAHNGRIHCSFHQVKGARGGTHTGRLSASNPNLQQISKRDKDLAQMVRGLFLPDHGQKWYSIDYSQMEFRVFAHYLKNKKLLDAYAENPDLDFHTEVSEMTGLPRNATESGGANAKQINLGLMFSMGAGRLAAEMGMPYTTEIKYGKECLYPGPEAAAIFEKYHKMVTGIPAFQKDVARAASARGYITTIMGRKIRFPNGDFTYRAAANLIQGSAADAMKVKIIECDDILDGTDAHLLLTVHDELNFSVPEGDTDLLKRINETLCKFGPSDAITFRVPITGAGDIGNNWWGE